MNVRAANIFRKISEMNLMHQMNTWKLIVQKPVYHTKAEQSDFFEYQYSQVVLRGGYVGHMTLPCGGLQHAAVLI